MWKTLMFIYNLEEVVASYPHIAYNIIWRLAIVTINIKKTKQDKC